MISFVRFFFCGQFKNDYDICKYNDCTNLVVKRKEKAYVKKKSVVLFFFFRSYSKLNAPEILKRGNEFCACRNTFANIILITILVTLGITKLLNTNRVWIFISFAFHS